MTSSKKRLQTLLVLLVFAAFAVLITTVFQLKPQAEKVRSKASHPQVQVETITAKSKRLQVNSHGLLQVANEHIVLAQTQGRIIYINDSLLRTGQFQQGDHLFSIDDSQAKYELQQALGQQKKAELQLAELEAHLRTQAQHQQQSSMGKISRLQLDLAKQQFDAASMAATLAQQQLDASQYYAPFDGAILQHQLKRDRMASIGMPLVTVYPKQQFQIRIPINLQQYYLLGLDQGQQENVLVSAIDDNSGTQIRGRIHQIEGQLSSNRLIYLNAIFDQLNDEQAKRLIPLSMMNVTLESAEVEGLIAIPDTALRGHNSVWLLDENNTLEIRTIELLHREPEIVYIKSGLRVGERLITSYLATAIPGMQLRSISNHE